MSAEGKKKRGAAGQTKAQTNPFRMNGWAPDWWARRAGAYHVTSAHSSGRKSITGLMGGVICERIGLGKFAGREAIYDRMIHHAEMRIQGQSKRYHRERL